MTISLKVVSDATVLCDSFRRSEMRRRTRFISARISFLLPGAAGSGVDSGFDSFRQDRDGAGFVSVIGGGGASFRFLMEGMCLWVLQPPTRQPSSDPRERACLRVEQQHL